MILLERVLICSLSISLVVSLGFICCRPVLKKPIPGAADTGLFSVSDPKGPTSPSPAFDGI